MVYLDSVKIKECIDIEKITKDTVTLNVDGEKLIRKIWMKISLLSSSSERLLLDIENELLFEKLLLLFLKLIFI